MYVIKLVVFIVGLAALAVSCALAQEGEDRTEPPKAGYWVVSTVDELVKAVSEAGAMGGAIVLRPGAYVLDRTLRLENIRLLNIEGSGWSTQIIRKGDGDAIELKNSHFCMIRNAMIVGDLSAAAGSGVRFVDSSSCVVDLCRITSFAQSGVYFEGNPKHPMSSNTVSNCHFIDNRGDQLYSFHNNDFYITGNQFGAHGLVKEKAPRTGCWLDHSSAGTYARNYHWNNRVAMRLGPGAHYNRIENNRFEEAEETGVIIGDPSGDSCVFNIITGNTFHTNSKEKMGAYPAAVAYNAHQTTFTSNQVFSWNSDHHKHKSSLILGAGCVNWIVKDNNFRHNTEKSLVYEESGKHIVADNLMD